VSVRAALVIDAVTLGRISAEVPPEDWRQRRLYVGEGAAQRWRRVGAEQDFRRPVGRLESALFGAGKARARRLAEGLLRSVVGSGEWSTFVSLGPGDARMDVDLVRKLGAGGSPPEYVAVDLSEELLLRAVEKLAGVTRSLGILADFESRFDFLASELLDRSESPRLFALLGNTLGNLDEGERIFLEQVTTMEGRGALLLSVSTKGPGWAVEAEPLLRPSGYSERVQRFLSHDAPERFQSDVRFDPGRSDVPDASAVDVFDIVRDRPLISVRRYDWRALLAWMREELALEVLFEEELVFDEVEAGGVALVRRRA
jgi:hypothetical protein